ncbi:Cytochrome P450 monooxygenase sdnE [Metarhizium brunneum]|uniref:Cytochrome P450 monooxygenase sdnE n=1 Tax=Metarhizium brunneum TaxID=500148 RepID=A0A7D5Z633_9HYPO|nr:Cytochrome P450 monooxygenase sdnE [Metarhizium brunneum]
MLSDVTRSLWLGPYTILLLIPLYGLLLAVFRLYFSPLSRFPGPRIAAATWWYQFYHDVVRRGRYIWVVRDMHARYGPIVRINPSELHICESQFYNTLYVSGGIHRKRDKWSWDSVGAGGVRDSALSTVAHDLHRVRRSAIAQFFSAQNVDKLQPVIQSKADLLVRRLAERRGRRTVVTNLNHAFSALTNDVIMEYCFARSYDRLAAPDFDPSYKHASHRGVRLAQIAKHIRLLGWLVTAMLALPESILVRCGPAFEMFLTERKRLHRQIEELTLESKAVGQDASHLTVFRELLGSKLPPEEKTPARLSAEAQVLVSAGSETTAKALTVACFKLLTHPAVLARLRDELETALPSFGLEPGLRLDQVQRLPYLTGVVKESLRLSYGVVGRLQRIWPDEEIVFREWIIPRGTPVSMTSYDVHHDEAVFPDSFAFRPERWADDPGLDRYLVSFGKGSRHCVGMNLAMAELYLTLAKVFRLFGSGRVRRPGDIGQLVLFETDESDIRMTGEVLVPFVKPDSRGVRVVVES